MTRQLTNRIVRRMGLGLAGLVNAAFVCVCISQSLASPVIDFDINSGSTGSNSNQSVGWQFDVLTPFTVTDLAWFDENVDGLATPHTVGIWDPGGALIASTVIPVGTTATLDGIWRTVSIAPLNLPVGSGYIVGGENFSSNTERLASGVIQSVDPRIQYIDATFSDLGSGFTRPTQFSVAFNGFYGVGFNVNPIPEPTTLALAALGLLGIGCFRRKRA